MQQDNEILNVRVIYMSQCVSLRQSTVQAEP